MRNDSEFQEGLVVPGPQGIHPPEDQDHPMAVPADQARTTVGPRTTSEIREWEEQLRAAVEKTLRERARKRDERAAFKRARDAGLIQRYALKEARMRAEAKETS